MDSKSDVTTVSQNSLNSSSISKYASLILSSEEMISIGDYEHAIDLSLKAIAVKDGFSEPYAKLAKCFYFLAQQGNDSYENWERCVNFSRRAMALPESGADGFLPDKRLCDIHRFLNVALSNLGFIREALESVNSGLDLNPDDSQLLYNKRLYEKHLASEDINKCLESMVKTGLMSESVKSDIRNYIDSKKSFLSYLPKFGKKYYDIVIYVGQSPERWNPDSVTKNGIGGSETAVIEMAKRLKSRGMNVRVYGDCLGMEGCFDGVEYVDYSRYGNMSCDFLVTSRRPSAIDPIHGVKANKTICWVHDVHMWNNLNPERALKIDKFFTLSQWHRSVFLNRYNFLSPEKVVVTRNGIDLSRFGLVPGNPLPTLSRNPHKALYGSSPDRGLQIAVSLWPLIRKHVPDAELHAFYGFQTWEAFADERQKKSISDLKNLIKQNEKNGVFFHGRVSQSKLADQYMSGGVWAYPTWFSETSCISAMEAHAAGLRMITTPLAALQETVGNRGTMINGSCTTPDYQNKFVEAVVLAMTKDGDDDRDQLRTYAINNFGWDSLTEEWISMFHSWSENNQDKNHP